MTIRYPYPERENNSFRLLVDGEHFLPAMEQAIASASHYILMEQYLVSSGKVADRFIDALIASVHRGVTVLLLLDHFGARGFSLQDRLRLQQAGVHLAFYNPAYVQHFFRGLPRNHRKVLIVDGLLAFAGGAGLTDDYENPGKGLSPWHDLMLEIRGPVVADWQGQFAAAWERWGNVPLMAEPAVSLLPAGQQSGRMVPSFRGRQKFAKKSLLLQIRKSQSRVWIATAYFLPPLFMLGSLRRARERGVDVRLLLPGPINDHPTVYQAGRRYYNYLLRHGIRIYEYQPAFMHAKYYLCDSWSSVGSCNMDRWGLRWNLEANQESLDPQLAGEVSDCFARDFNRSHEFTLEAWRLRSRWQRFGEWLFGYGDLLIERFGAFRSARKGDMEPGPFDATSS